MLTADQVQMAKNRQLSTNFTLYEAIKSDGHPDMVVYPSEDVIQKLEVFYQTVVQPIRNQWGRIKIDSGYRNSVLNAAVGGVSDSVHLIYDGDEFLGVASDLVPLDNDLITVFEWASKNIPAMKTIIIYRLPAVTRTKFFHIDTRVTRDGVAVLEKVGPDHYVPYSEK